MQRGQRGRRVAELVAATQRRNRQTVAMRDAIAARRRIGRIQKPHCCGASAMRCQPVVPDIVAVGAVTVHRASRSPAVGLANHGVTAAAQDAGLLDRDQLARFAGRLV